MVLGSLAASILDIPPVDGPIVVDRIIPLDLPHTPDVEKMITSPQLGPDNTALAARLHDLDSQALA